MSSGRTLKGSNYSTRRSAALVAEPVEGQSRMPALRAVRVGRACAAASPGYTGLKSTNREDARMRIHNIYVDAKGETHFRDVEVKWVEGEGVQQVLRAAQGHGHHLPRDLRRLRPRLASRPAPAVHHQPRRRREDHRQRRREPGDRRRRGDPGRGHQRQGPSVEVRERQDAALDFRADRLMSFRGLSPASGYRQIPEHAVRWIPATSAEMTA